MDRAFLGPREAAFVRQRLQGLPRPVSLIAFGDPDSEPCTAVRQLAEEIAAAVPEVRAVALGRAAAAEAFAAFGVDEVPALAVTPDPKLRPDNGIRFFGFPGGYEFDSLLDAIVRVAAGEPGLAPEMVEFLAGLGSTALHLEVFVTPTCPYCPRMVQLAHRMALLHPAVRADMIDASEFPHWAAHYEVRGVPLTVVNGALRIEGLVPERRLLQQLQAFVVPVHRPA